MRMTQLASDHQWAGSMLDRTQEEWDVLSSEWGETQTGLADRVLEHLAELDREKSVFPLTRLGHSLQVATRAARAGRDDEYVFCALLHDIGDTLGAYNHADIGAAIVKPFVRPAYHWMVENHDVFQGYFFWHFLGRDRDAREKYRGHPNFDLTAEFCEDYDQSSFDVNYANMRIEDFRPLVRDLMSRPWAHRDA
jgi:predicted HD phosphohydrolase